MRFSLIVVLITALLSGCSKSEQKNVAHAEQALPMNLLIVKRGFTLDQHSVEHIYAEADKTGQHYNIHVFLTEKAGRELQDLTLHSLDNVMLPVFGDTVISKGSMINGAIGRNFIMGGYDKATAEHIVTSVRKKTMS